MCNHELRANPRSRKETDAIVVDQAASGGRRADDDQSGTRPGGPEMRLAHFPTEPVRDAPTSRQSRRAIRRDECATAVAHERERMPRASTTP